jgi:hypothetical protein
MNAFGDLLRQEILPLANSPPLPRQYIIEQSTSSVMLSDSRLNRLPESGFDN